MQTPKIIEIPAKVLVGMSTIHSLVNRRTKELWSSFMPRRGEIQNRVDENLYSVQVYAPGFQMQDFRPTTEFRTWAAVELPQNASIPNGMDTILLPGGLYAVFIHKGAVDSFHETASYIFETWIPQSGYQVDDRPHFEILGELYLGPMNPASQEEVWVPIKKKSQ